MNRWDWLGLFDIYQMIFWCVTYIECIRIGIKEKTYCMPLLALCMNFCWEILSFYDCVVYKEDNESFYVLYGVWALLDIMIVWTYCKFGREELEKSAFKATRDNSKFLFVTYSMVVFIIVLAILIILYNFVDNWKMYFSFTDNVVMSALFIVMYYVRGGKRGQSLSIAVTKCIGTFCATLTMILAEQLFGILLGLLCLLLDIVYIVILSQRTLLLPDGRSVMTLD